MPSKHSDEIRDLLIRRNRCLYKYANGIRKYKEALKKLKELEQLVKDKLIVSTSDDAWLAVRLTFDNKSFTVCTTPDKLDNVVDTEVAYRNAVSPTIDTLFSQSVVVFKLEETVLSVFFDNQ